MGSHICCTCALLDTVALAPAQTPRAAQTATREAMLLIVFMTDHVMDLTGFNTNIDIDVDIDIVFSSRRVSDPSTRSTCKGWPPAMLRISRRAQEQQERQEGLLRSRLQMQRAQEVSLSSSLLQLACLAFDEPCTQCH